MTNNKYTLTQGPSRELLFDSLRLGGKIKELQVLEFWGIQNFENGAKGGSSLPIEIEGIQSRGKGTDDWFFWGRRKQITSGDKWVLMADAKYVDFAFGRWNTQRRSGFVRFSDTSELSLPLLQED